MKTVKIILAILMVAIAGAIVFAGLGPDYCVSGASAAGIFMMAFNFADLSWSDGAKNMGGIKTVGYYALIDDIDTFPELPTNPSSAAEEVTLDGDFVMKSQKYFHKLYSTMETAEVKDEVQGERDGKSFKHTAEFFFPGTSDDALAFAANANNSKMVFIFEEASGGNRRVIGSVGLPAEVSCAFTTGKATADRKGMTVTVTSFGYTPAPLYDGVIHLNGEVVS